MRTNKQTSNAEDNRVGVHDGLPSWHMGNMMDIDATDREAPVNETTVYRLEDDKAGKKWAAVDSRGILQQLGVVEPSEGS